MKRHSYHVVAANARRRIPGTASRYRSGVASQERRRVAGAASRYRSGVALQERRRVAGAASRPRSGVALQERRRVPGAASRYRSDVALQERRRHHVSAGGVIMSWWRGCVTSKSTSVTPDGAVTAFHIVGTNEVSLVMYFGRFIFVGSAAEWMFDGPCRQSAVQLSHRIYMAYNNRITISPPVGLCMDSGHGLLRQLIEVNWNNFF